MRRRAFAIGAGPAALAATAARGQGAGPPVVGFLRSTSAADSVDIVEAFRRGLAENGFDEGRNVVVELHFADNRQDRLAELARELAGRRVAVIVGNALAALAAQAVTTTVTIVFISGEDPVRLGLVASISRPQANITGVGFLDAELAAKRFGILHEMTPRLATIGVLVDPGSPGVNTEIRSVEEASRTLGRRILVIRASSEAEIDAAFAAMAAAGVLAVFVGVGPIYNSRRARLAALASRYRLPASYGLRSFAEAGGLLSYGANLPDTYRRAARHVARILRGAKPADLPVDMPTTYELVVNLRAARAIDFQVPPTILAIADEVID